jgi:hypothetical protein
LLNDLNANDNTSRNEWAIGKRIFKTSRKRGPVHHLLNILRSLVLTREFWASIAGALVGGLCVVVAQLISNRAQRKRDREAESGAVKAILRAIEAELKMFNEKALIRLEEIFKARERSR